MSMTKKEREELVKLARGRGRLAKERADVHKADTLGYARAGAGVCGHHHSPETPGLRI